MSANLDDDLDDYKLDSVFHTDPDYVLHTSFRRDLGRGLRKVKVEDKWYRERELGAGTFGSVYLEVTSDQRQRAVKQISKHLATRLGIDYKTELSALAMFAKAKVGFLLHIGFDSIHNHLANSINNIKLLWSCLDGTKTMSISTSLWSTSHTET
jgi:hypothetical protein